MSLLKNRKPSGPRGWYVQHPVPSLLYPSSLYYDGHQELAYELSLLRVSDQDRGIYRKSTRIYILKIRGNQVAKCDYPGCGNPGTDIHEIINSGDIKPNTWQQLLTYQPALCSLLCQEHLTQADSPQVRDVLFEHNILRHGYGAVSVAYDLLKLALPTLDIGLPGEKYSDLFNQPNWNLDTGERSDPHNDKQTS